MTRRPYLELFPGELLQFGVPEWRILLIFAYDGQSTMYQIKKKYGLKYPPVHRSTKNLEKLGWVKVIERKCGQRGHTTKVYGLTLLGLLHLLYRIPKGFQSTRIYTIRTENEFLPKEVKTDLRKLHTRQDVALYLLYCLDFDQIAESNQRLLPLIYGKWDHFKKNSVTINVFSTMTDVAHVTLGDYYDPTRRTRTGALLQKLFTHKVYYNLLKKSLFESYPRKRKGYASFDYEDMIQQKTIAVFQNDSQLTDLFKQICTRLEKEIASLSKSIEKIKTAILST